MTKETKDFIQSLFEYYKESSSGREPDNEHALLKAWDELDAIDEGNKEFLALVWKVATDSVKNAAHGNQNIGALNDCFIETRKRLNELGVTNDEIKSYE